MTSIERLAVTGLMALSAMGGATAAVYVRPLQPPQQIAGVTPMPQAQPAPTVRTVTWFKDHSAERKQKLALCRDNPGLGQLDPECLNAEHAASEVSFEAFIK